MTCAYNKDNTIIIIADHLYVVKKSAQQAYDSGVDRIKTITGPISHHPQLRFLKDYTA